MGEIFTSLSKWLSECPLWLQIAATRLLQQPELSEKDISELVNLCLQEACGNPHQMTCSFPAGTLTQSETGSLRLCAVSEVEGINGLAPKKPLEFGSGNITIVYGNNGSGKSGYVRLLKHVCGARAMEPLHKNVYKPGDSIQKACISFELNGIQQSYMWTGQGVCEDLTSVDIFDTSFGKVFVGSEDEVSYEPPVLTFFSLLIHACERVASALDAKTQLHPSKKPSIPSDMKATPEGIWYEAISDRTTRQDIDKHCAFDSHGEAEMHILQQRIAEQSPAEKSRLLRKQKHHIENLTNLAKKHQWQLSDENCQRIIASKKQCILKDAAAETAAKKVFSDSELEGIGSDVWKELWEAARRYSMSAAYKDLNYPNVTDGSRCVLCHQSLSQEAKDRLVSFEKFVRGETQKAAMEAANVYKGACQTIEVLPAPELLQTCIDAARIPDEIVSQVKDFFAQLQIRKDKLLGDNPEEAVAVPLPPLKWINEVNTLSKSLDALAEKYDEDAQSDNREDLRKQLSSMQTRKWLSEHLAAINEEVERLICLFQIQKAKKLTNTKSLSLKKGELAEALITDAFVQRFNTELRALGASQLKVELVRSKVSKGRVLHKLQLQGASQYKLADVLSEGESRIVSIAAFLADVTGSTYSSPFIFDDPISSLDQNFEEAVVQRLCSIASKRQVIIFTHRLSLLAMIQDYAKKVNINPEIVCIRKEPWGTGEPGDTPLQAQKPSKALNTLIDTHLPKAKKLFNDSGFDAYESKAKAICSEFRILLERMIEYELMADVVQRYRRAINTMGKIIHLAKISEDDCKFFDDLMTKYSRYEHSQPSEAPVPLPEPHELEEDFIALKRWHDEFKSR